MTLPSIKDYLKRYVEMNIHTVKLIAMAVNLTAPEHCGGNMYISIYVSSSARANPKLATLF